MITTETEFDTKTYGKLLMKTHPGVTKSEAENDRILAIIESLMAKGDDRLTREEDALLELLLDLVHDFERQHYPIPASPPHEIVAFLLEQRGMERSGLRPVLGSKSRVSEVLSGKRGISKEQAKKLAAFFGVGAQLFI